MPFRGQLITTQAYDTTKLSNNKTLKGKRKEKKKKKKRKKEKKKKKSEQEGMRGTEMKYKRKRLQNGSS